MVLTLCPCGKPLHYASEISRKIVSGFVAVYGADVTVVVNGRIWLVPRHFIALHGLKGSELPELAERYGFKEIKDDDGR